MRKQIRNILNGSKSTGLNPPNSMGLNVNYPEFGVIEVNVTEFSHIKGY